MKPINKINKQNTKILIIGVILIKLNNYLIQQNYLILFIISMPLFTTEERGTLVPWYLDIISVASIGTRLPKQTTEMQPSFSGSVFLSKLSRICKCE